MQIDGGHFAGNVSDYFTGSGSVETVEARRPYLRLLACAAGWLLVVSSACAQAPLTKEVKSFQQFYDLPRDQALKGQPVRVQAVVVCYDSEWNQLYLHDGDQVGYFNPHRFATQPATGQRVEISGTTTLTEGNPGLTNLNLTVLGPGRLPPAKRLELTQLAADYGQWIETGGRVRVADTSWGRLALLIHEQGQTCLVYVMEKPATNDFRWLIDSQVRIRGVNASKGVNGRLDAASVFVPRFSELTVVEPAKGNPLQAPVIAIGSLLNRELGPWTNNRVRVSGWVAAYQPGQTLLVKDPTGAIQAKVAQVTQAKPDERVDVWGFLRVSPQETVLSDAFFEITQTTTSASHSAREATPKAISYPATPMRVMDIQKLPREEAMKHLPIRLRGVVTYADPEWRNGFIQDDSDAIYADLNQKDIRPGQWVELTGQTGPGGFATELINCTFQVLGATNLPAPAKVDLVDMASGQLDAHWVEMEGVVRGVNEQWGHLYLSLMTAQGRFKAILPEFNNQPLPTHLVDARVRVQGACSSEINARRQLSGITLHVPSLEKIRILEPAPANPFMRETTQIESVGTFDTARLAGRRVKISGVVSLKTPQQGFFLQDASGGIRVQTQQTNQINSGDKLDVLGFATIGGFAPSLEEAIFRQTGTGPPPVPRKTTAEQILFRGTNDGLVVQIDARLLQNAPHSPHPEFALQDGSVIFTASIETPAPGQGGPSLRSGSLLRLTGVCSIKGNERHEPESFRLLVGNWDGVALLTSPPWWSLRYTLMLAGVLTVFIAAALGWVASLRRRVRAQTEVIRQKLAMTATLEERYRELFENANDLLFILDVEGQCTTLNRAAERFLGVSPQGSCGKNLTALLGTENQAPRLAPTRLLLSDRTEEHLEVEARRGDGKLALLDVHFRVIQENSRRIGIQATARDMTELKKAQEELLCTSRLAGMAEVATGVLHNVGNVLNSVNVSTTVINDQILALQVSGLTKATQLLSEHEAELGTYLTLDPQGKRIPSYLQQLAAVLSGEQAELVTEVASLVTNIEHIKEIVAMQQSYASVSGVWETLAPATVLDDALQMNAAAFERHKIKVIRDYQTSPAVTLDRHKLLQILLNLLHNAKYALSAKPGQDEKRLTVSVGLNGSNRLRLAIRDNGVGIAPENLSRIFRFGFTTKTDGHGFGLHMGALAAGEMGGSLSAHSGGLGLGATFTLELPLSQHRTEP